MSSADNWASGDAYELFMGRWSRTAARAFLSWLAAPRLADWLDVGCGAGALTETILAQSAPAAVTGVDPSASFLDAARARVGDKRATFLPGDAMALDFADGQFDAVVSGLALNFVPDPARALFEMARVTRPGGLLGVYLWDYADGMEMLRRFWDATVELDPSAGDHHEGRRFPFCAEAPLSALFRGARLLGVETRAIDIRMVFRDFDDYWQPFLGGQGPGPAYVARLPEQQQAALRERLRATLPAKADGSIELPARAWAIKGRRAYPAR